VPRGKQKLIGQNYHDSPIAGHCGVSAMTQMIAAKYFWPRIGASCASFVRNCDVCLHSKARHKKPGKIRLLAPSEGCR